MTPDLPAVELAIVEATNVFRAENRLKAVRRNPQLDRAARAYARYLARTGKFSHTADGRRLTDRTREAGYNHCLAAENLALNADSRGFAAKALARAAVTGWIKSPGHRRNMLLTNATEIGVGVAKARLQHRYLSVQLFGRPKRLSFSFRIRNTSRRSVHYVFDGQASVLPRRTVVTHTTCIPGQLTIRRAAGDKGAGQFRERTFRVATEDEFHIVPIAGGIRVEHHPKSN
ncbi:MAG: CAP domain-containing protein [Hyphomicrobiaceae bacterium]